ncbi:unnamed protein product [Bemisia tabaci]|uniref:Calcyclin-binding protein n=1 Tax=Bemisia tabaci TaxID=7038 RepID=A0A9P0C942_BEMTA|nr:PREDICTED: calcyclin-binding protein isoform X1 [Bemisia tabaci]XP_018902754.1 PREDICTED: calcyclin-binding protein isoform X2 [Bemisia tabaci]CAH0767046.1 unnamed protein product [Bemisia tabaci]
MEKKLAELRLDIAELKALEAQASRPKVQEILSLEVRKLETLLVQKTEQSSIPVTATNQTGKTPVVSNTPRSYEIQLTNYGWDQSDKFVKLFVTLPNVHQIPETNVTHEFTERSVALHVRELENKNYCFKVANLLETIDAQKSYIKIKKDTVVVFLEKNQKGINWSHLTSIDKAAKEARLPKIDKDDEDPSSGMMKMLQSIYEDGDDTMKQTIAKAWTESRNKSF